MEHTNKHGADFHTRAVEGRIDLTNEWHARPGLALPTPMRCSHIVSLRSETTLDQSRANFAEFCRGQGVSLPAEGCRQHVVDIGACKLKWEGHTEATSHTILVPGNGQPPFSENALDFLEKNKRSQLVNDMFIGVHVEVLEADESDESRGLDAAKSLLGSHQVYGGSMSANSATVWSAFKLDADGFIRIVVVDKALSLGGLSRLLQRVLEMETYRMLAMMALPRAREAMTALGSLEPEVLRVMNELESNKSEQHQEQSLREITGLAARVERIASAHAYPFAAARAYASIVERRAVEVDEQIFANNQRYTNFLLRSLQPAMRTCDATELRSNELAQRVARAANLLDTMVDMVKKKQNQDLLETMAERAKTQLRLQQAVEGFSIFAISYYAVGLIDYCLQALSTQGIAINHTLVTGLAVPIVFATVWLQVRSVRKRLSKST